MSLDQRAYSTFEVKAVDADKRIVEGWATTPAIDSVDDSLDPMGAVFRLPMAFKFRHGQNIGEVFAAEPDAKRGIYIKARVSTSDHPPLKAMLDDIWALFKAQPPLIRGLSVGWKPIDGKPIPNTKATRWSKWLWGETSAVEIPANLEATITAVKSFDASDSAAMGTGQASSPSIPAAMGHPVVKVQRMAQTIPEQITSFQNERAAKASRMIELMSATNGSTLDEAGQQTYDELSREVKGIDAHLIRLDEANRLNIAAAKPVETIASSHTTVTTPRITVKPNVPPGTAFTRMAMAIAAGKGDYYRTMEHAKNADWANTPEVELMVKAAVAAGTTTDATWAGPFVSVQPLVDEFLDLLRPATLIGRIPGLRRVPFNISMPSQTTGGTYGWVGQGLAKPVTKADYSTVTLAFAKAAGIIVLTEELVKLSKPSAEEAVRREMIDGMSQFLDVQFNDPAVAAVANVNPASITNGASTAAASGVTGAAAKADLAASVAVFTAAGIPLNGSVWLMSDSNAFGLAMSVNALGQPLFPGMSITGGSIFGMPVVVSNNVSTRVILVHAPSILYADDGGVSIDVSREASIQMDSAPSNPTDATTVLVSLWQRNLVGLKAERFITWTRARTAAVRYITAAAYIGT